MARKIIAPEASRKRQSTSLEESEGELTRTTEDANHRKALAKYEMRKELVTVADKVAQHTFYTRNYKFRDADKLFPDHWDKRTVTKHYPMAHGGALLVDEPQNEWETERAFEKHKVLKKLGYRHIVIESDTTVDHCLEQLGEL